MNVKAIRRALTFVGAALLSLATATAASAQGMFYQELTKDGRIYVFNLGASFERFQKTGEMGVGITKLSYGPNGETVMFDSEEAIDLYNFKHGVALVVEKPKKPKMEFGWRDGKTTFTTDKAQLVMSNRVQIRFTDVLPDDSVQLAGTENKGDSQGSFRIRRAKFKLDGWFYVKELTYEVQLNWPAATGSNIGAFLEDANIDWDLSKKGTFRLKFGQFKYAQGRQELTSSGSQSFVDRSLVENRYSLGRDTGVQLWGTVLQNKLEWRVGAFNGNGLTRTVNDNDKYLLAARVQLQPKGDPRYSEGDFESAGKLLYALAAFYNKNDLHFTTTGNDLKHETYGFDAVVKKSGLFLTAAYYNRESTPETGAAFTDEGWHGQAGYLFGKQHWELGFRYGQFDPTSLVTTNDKQTEIGGVLSYYYNKHNLKLQADFRSVKNEAANSGKGATNNELRVQTQFIF